MSYEYTDAIGWKLKVTASMGAVWVAASPEEGVQTGVEVKPGDAPAVALAILEAAGNADINSMEAMNRLREYVNLQGAQAEREAEDAKVREFRETSMSAIASIFDGSNPDSKGWDSLSEDGRRGWRARYRAARDFFRESP